MNVQAKRIIQFLLVNDVCWFLLRPFVYVTKRLTASRVNFVNRKTEESYIALCNNLFAQQTILHGLFKGVRFNGIEATGSSVYAKLLGSYEQELIPHLQRLLIKQHSHFINVGCDEGYYAIGIAKHNPSVKVIAFDCNKKAQERCKSLAQLNNVAERVEVKGCFAANEIPVTAQQTTSLFIIDCEGCENDIIDKALVEKFAFADFIIELHYEVQPLVLGKLQQVFAATHKVSLVTALSDHERVMNHHFHELDNLSYKQKMFILEERVGFMQWLVAEPLINPLS